MRPLKLTEAIKNEIMEDFRKKLDKVNLSSSSLSYQYSMTSLKYDKDKRASIEFSVQAYVKTILYLTFCDKEVGWYGLIQRGEADNYFYVSDIFLYPQTVTAASVRSPQNEFADWQDGFDAEEFEKLRFFCHSHANMSTTPSSYDLEVQQEITNQLSGDQFYVFMIMNKQHDFWAKICDCKHNTVYEGDDVDLILPYIYGVHENDIESEIASNVKSVSAGASIVSQYPYRGGVYTYTD